MYLLSWRWILNATVYMIAILYQSLSSVALSLLAVSLRTSIFWGKEIFLWSNFSYWIVDHLVWQNQTYGLICIIILYTCHSILQAYIYLLKKCWKAAIRSTIESQNSSSLKLIQSVKTDSTLTDNLKNNICPNTKLWITTFITKKSHHWLFIQGIQKT